MGAGGVGVGVDVVVVVGVQWESGVEAERDRLQ